MEQTQLKFDSYSLVGKKANNVAFLLYKSLNNNYIIEQIITYFGLDVLLDTKLNGIISNLLIYFINIDNELLIKHILEKYETILMKRDYLNIINYYWNTNREFAIELFDLKKVGSQCEAKDINFIIKHNMIQLLEKLIGLFIKLNITDPEIANPEIIDLKNQDLKLFSACPIMCNDIIDMLVVPQLKTLLFNFDKINFGAIIDAGNVIHCRKGKFSYQSIIDLNQIINETRYLIGEPLIIIHKKHLKDNSKILELFNLNKVQYYQTPYNVDDDLFIIWFFLKLQAKCFIISNDKYRDHIFKYDTQSSITQFKNIIKQQTLNYNIDNMIGHIIAPKPLYSKCIQQIDNKIYIPTNNNMFIKLNII